MRNNRTNTLVSNSATAEQSVTLTYAQIADLCKCLYAQDGEIMSAIRLVCEITGASQDILRPMFIDELIASARSHKDECRGEYEADKGWLADVACDYATYGGSYNRDDLERISEHYRASLKALTDAEQALDALMCEKTRMEQAAKTSGEPTSDELATAYAKVQDYIAQYDVRNVGKRRGERDQTRLGRKSGTSDRKWSSMGLSMRKSLLTIDPSYTYDDKAIVIDAKAYHAAKRAYDEQQKSAK